MSRKELTILQVSTYDIAGGAEKIAWNLFSAYAALGHGSWLAVRRSFSGNPRVVQVPEPRQQAPPWARLCWLAHGRVMGLESRYCWAARLCAGLRSLAQGIPEFQRELGWEDFNFPGTRQLLRLPGAPPDILHCHNLHGGYFDLRKLPWLSRRTPTVLTLHDEWLFTGHCAAAFSCGRWRSGCGSCPDLSIYPSLRRDATARNWRRKRKIYAGSRLYVAAPSSWLMDRIERSMLEPGIVEKRVIPNGVDVSLFSPGDRQQAKARLGLPLDTPVLLFAANQIRANIFRDYDTVRRAIGIASAQMPGCGLLFIGLGEDAPEERMGNAVLRFIPYQADPAVVAAHYRAADIYIHATRADTFSNTVLEARACGTPVIATAVGGVPDQIIDGTTGILVPPSDSAAMAHQITLLLQNPDMRARLAEAGARDAHTRFSLGGQARAYLDWYEDILERSPMKRAAQPNRSATLSKKGATRV